LAITQQNIYTKYEKVAASYEIIEYQLHYII